MKNEVADLLARAYERKKRERTRFSRQVLANRLGVSLTYISDILNGKRPLPLRLVGKICEALDMDLSERERIAKQLLREKSLDVDASFLDSLSQKNRLERGPRWNKPEKRAFWLLDEWYYLPLLDATLLKNYDGTPGFMARRLGLPVETVEQALERLEREGLLAKKQGFLRKSQRFNEFFSASSQEAIRKYHRKSLVKAESCLTEKTADEDVARRIFTTYTMTVPRRKIAEARRKILDFAKDTCEELADEAGEDVFQLSVQFFPLTETGE